MSYASRKLEAERRIYAHGWRIRYVDYCEDSQTPGLLGQIRGVTLHPYKEIKISTKANTTPAMMAEILEHELRHVEDPSWDCGNRDVLGRGHA